MEIKDAKVIVTGGSSGIGKETARQLVAAGAKVVITGRDSSRLEKAATDTGAMPLVFDIRQFDTIPANAQQAISLLGGVDVLINNAGIGIFSTLAEVTATDFLDVYATNVFGLALFTKEVIPIFQKQSFGNIINVGSTAANKGFNGGTVYASSKFALRGMTQTWHTELRPYNIRVSLVNPSEVTTAFGNNDRNERAVIANKLGPTEIAHTIISILKMNDKGFVPEVSIWATNPF